MPDTARVAITLLTRDIAASVDFYEALTGFTLQHSEDWYAVLAASAESEFQIGLIDWTSEFVPRAARGEAQGVFLQIEVSDVPAALAAVSDFRFEIIEGPRAFEEMTRAVIRDLDGHVIDLVSPGARFRIPPRKAVA